MSVLPPGTILQLEYLFERLKRIKSGCFVEIGPGSGEITQLLLNLGWSGVSYDLEKRTIERLKDRFSSEIKVGKYNALNVDYLLHHQKPKSADLIISCMVLEHLDNISEQKFMHKSSMLLKGNGLMIHLVPASPAHWGIEDEIAGHYRRYTFNSVSNLVKNNNWDIEHLAGLTFPISNCLLPISNFLVGKYEKSKLSLEAIDKTKQSGRSYVRFKTHFPFLLKIILNRYSLWPLHLLQKAFKDSDSALVIYFECKLKL